MRLLTLAIAAAAAIGVAAQAPQIIPAPKMLYVDNMSRANISQGFRPDSLATAIMASTTASLAADSAGLPLRIIIGAPDAAYPPVAGAYSIELDRRGALVNAADTTGAYYALRTLMQLAEAAPGATVPSVDIIDYPTLPTRGIVEGFYGVPWSHDMRLSMLDLCGDFKLNTYVYGPKDDTYHRSPNWRVPYPADEAAQIAELAQRAAQNRVNFCWAIAPGLDIKWTDEDYAAILAKFEQMYGLGVRQFAVFFDDISGEGARSDMHVKLVNDLTRDFVATHPGVADIMICPTDYTKMWASPHPMGQLGTYGRGLKQGIDVLYTGDGVFSDINPDVLAFVDNLILRPALVWWNFPVSDYCRDQLLLGPAYGLSPDVTAYQASGFLTNPMENGEASKPAIISVADYAWSPASYDAMDMWRRAAAIIEPAATAHYLAFAEHSADSRPKGYRRDESWSMPQVDFDAYTPEQWDALAAYFQTLEAVPQALRSGMANRQLLAEIEPWLATMEASCHRAALAAMLLRDAPGLSKSAIAKRLRDIKPTEEQQQALDAHKWGTKRIQPFITEAIERLSAN